MKRVLILEDEASIREFVVINLQSAGYETVEAENGEAALRIFAEENGRFDIALLDVMMPGIDGFEVCRQIRQQNALIGIIMLTARTQESDKINGLMLGADDYITKPFSPSELVARAEALCRRIEAHSKHENEPQTCITSGPFSLDLHSRTLKRNGEEIELTQTEFQIMELFFKNEHQPLSRKEILDAVWSKDERNEEKIVDVNMRRLRMKVEEDASAPKHIVTVWGKGYQWQN